MKSGSAVRARAVADVRPKRGVRVALIRFAEPSGRGRRVQCRKFADLLIKTKLGIIIVK